MSKSCEISKLQEELERQVLLNERLNGEGVDGLRSEELMSLESQLIKGVANVDKELAKKEPGMEAKQAEMGRDWTNEKITAELRLWVRCKRTRKKARELLRSFEEHGLEALVPCEIEIEIETLKLLNEYENAW